jgi:hypothetical protein
LKAAIIAPSLMQWKALFHNFIENFYENTMIRPNWAEIRGSKAFSGPKWELSG